MKGTFVSAPSAATSADARTVWLAALDDNFEIGVRKLTDMGKTGEDWVRLSGHYSGAPALTCSPDGSEAHLFTIDGQLGLRHRVKVGGGDWGRSNTKLDPQGNAVPDPLVGGCF